MAKIDGMQSARETMRIFTDLLLPRAPEDEASTDVVAVTTEGLYMCNAGESAHALRERLWKMGDCFRRQFHNELAQAHKKDPRIIPQAYEIETFDALRARASGDFRQLFGLLKGEVTTNPRYREKISADLDRLNQPMTEDKTAFLNEEFVWGWLVYKGRLRLRENGALRRHREGQTIVCYPGDLMASQIEAYRLLTHATGALPMGRSLYVNTVRHQDEDVAATVAGLERREPLGKKIPRVKLSAFAPT